MKKSLSIFGKNFKDVAGIKVSDTDSIINRYIFDFNDEKHLNFYDYDGTLVRSFTTIEALSLTSLPSNPSHEGLTSQGWNWSLSDIKSYLTKYPNADVNVGQMYITSDGKTRIYITLDDSDNLSPALTIAVNGTVYVNWGDGSASDTLTGSSDTASLYLSHEYSETGNYIITIEVASGLFSFISNGTNYTGVLVLNDVYTHTARRTSTIYSSRITKILIGANAQIKTQAFFRCQSLQSVTIPDGITSIDSGAFRYCYSLQSITIPDSVTSIDSYVFSNCQSLQSIAIPDGVTRILANAIDYCILLKSITIPDSVESVGAAFQSCRSLRSIVIPDGVTSISNNTFNGCYSLQSITIPDNVTSIGSTAFQYCYSLQSITIPDSVTSIGSDAFNGCRLLQSITIPDGLTTINASLFTGCKSLKSITIPDGVTTIGNSVFYDCYSLKSITIPDSVTSIGTSAFTNCLSLQSITIPDGVTIINTSILMNCNLLQSITLPDGVTTIGDNAFNGCYSLQSITIPDSVTSIGSNALISCYGMLEYHFEPTVPPTIASNTFNSNSIKSDTIIYVPYSADHSVLNAYKTANYWSTYANYMQEEPQS